MSKEVIVKADNLPVVRKNNLPAVQVGQPIQNLDAYIRMANQVPMLTREEELELAQRLKNMNDMEAAQRLILSHLRFVVKIARGFSGYGLPQADLIQEGNIGLMKAVKRYDHTMGVRLVSFAVHWVKAEMHEYIIKNWRMVKIATTKAQRKLFFNLRSKKKRLGFFSKEEIKEVAEQLNVKPSEVIEMERRLNNYDAAFDAPTDSSADQDEVFAPSQFLESSEPNPAEKIELEDWEQQTLDKLHTGLGQLDDRSKDILQSRYLAEKKATLHELAAKYEISAERVRQLENQA